MKKYKKLLLAGAMFAALSLTACASTSDTGAAQTDTQAKRLDSALEKAAYQAAAQGKVDDSLALLEKLYKRNSTDPRTAMNYAQALREAGRINRAALILLPFANKDGNADAKAEFASIQAAMGDYERAESYARQAIAIEPDNAKAHQVLGITLDTQGKYDEAETSFRFALERWEGNPSTVLNNLGLNLAAQGKLEEALAVLEEAATASPYREEIERNIRIVTALQDAEGSVIPMNAPEPNKKPQL